MRKIPVHNTSISRCSPCYSLDVNCTANPISGVRTRGAPTPSNQNGQRVFSSPNNKPHPHIVYTLSRFHTLTFPDYTPVSAPAVPISVAMDSSVELSFLFFQKIKINTQNRQQMNSDAKMAPRARLRQSTSSKPSVLPDPPNPLPVPSFGDGVGNGVATSVGFSVVGSIVGPSVGLTVGTSDGLTVGPAVGAVGSAVVGSSVGASDGFSVG